MEKLPRIKLKEYQFELCFDRKTIHDRILQIAKAINEHYQKIIKEDDKIPAILVICTLKGAFMFYSDLIKQVSFEVNLEFIQPSSYVGFQSTGKVNFEKFIAAQKIKDQHILIIEDIVDTGVTVKEIIEKIKLCQPKSIEVCALFKRPHKEYACELKFWGFETDGFIVGYGLDYDQRGRNFPEVYTKVDE